MYIGHRREDGEIQQLRDHLLGVAERARGFAETFGAGRHAYRTGLMHDIGKYAPDVQRRMADPEHVRKVNHTSAGAIAASGMRDLYAAFAIAGHHGGLSDLGARTSTPEDGTLQGKLKYRPQDHSACRQEVEPDPSAAPPAWIGMDKLAGSFYTRMLFSCLVDADYLDTEAFMRGDEVRREGGESMGALLDALRAGSYTRRTIRRLQRDSVNVYREHAQNLLGAGKAIRTPDGFLILADADSYDDRKGLSICDDPGQAIFM